MTMEAIREAVHTQPFRSFRLRLAGGPIIEVPHPDFIALGPKGRTVIVFGADESYKVLDTTLINGIGHGARRGNGKR